MTDDAVSSRLPNAAIGRPSRASCDAHQPAVYAVCRRIVGNETDALDAIQDSLIAIVRGLDRFDGRSKFSTWVYRIATKCLPRRAPETATAPDPRTPGRGAGRAVSDRTDR